MMATSADHQKQKPPWSKPRRLARSIVRQFIPLPKSQLKHLGLVSASIITGFSLPALVYASYQTNQAKLASTNTSSVTIQNTTPSEQKGVVSYMEHKSSDKSPPDSSGNIQIVVNGTTIPTDPGSVTRHIVTDDGSQIDVNVTIENTVSSDSLGSTTNISVDSSSSSQNGQNSVRGSP